jgi:hypothetical protein
LANLAGCEIVAGGYGEVERLPGSGSRLFESSGRRQRSRQDPAL